MKKSLNFTTQAVYWLGYFSLLLLFYQMAKLGGGPSSLSSYFKITFGSIILPSVIGFYTSYYYLFEKCFKTKQINSLVIYGIVLSVLYATIGIIITSVVKGSFFIANDGFIGILLGIILFSLIPLANGIIGLFIRSFINRFEIIAEQEKLSQQNTEMELALVKSKLNPHFLFNTLNNIDVLIEKDSLKASEYLHKLSDILRYTLYEAENTLIPLKTELSYIEKYIDLENIRSANKIAIYNVNGNINDVSIFPMTFIPFIENAFKHSSKKDEAIKIDVSVSKQNITFECTNAKDITVNNLSNLGNIGNNLIKKRLSILYANNYQLEIKNESKLYSVKLTIQQ